MKCPACDDGDNCSVISAYTVIDHTEFEDKKGKRRKDELKLLIAKTKTFKTIKKKQKRKGSLRGIRFAVSRLTKDSPNAGDDFEIIGETKLPDKIQPAPYHLVFKPRTPKEMIDYFQLATTEYTDEDIPF